MPRTSWLWRHVFSFFSFFLRKTNNNPSCTRLFDVLLATLRITGLVVSARVLLATLRITGLVVSARVLLATLRITGLVVSARVLLATLRIRITDQVRLRAYY